MVDLTGSASVQVPDVRVETDHVVQANAGRLARIARMIDGGHLKVKTEEMVPFEHAPDALEHVLTKHVCGKIGLEISQEHEPRPWWRTTSRARGPQGRIESPFLPRLAVLLGRCSWRESSFWMQRGNHDLSASRLP